MGVGEQERLAFAAAVPDRPDGVDHDTCRQVPGVADDGTARRAEAARAVALLEVGHDRRAARSMDGAVHAAAAAQSAVGGVDDRVGARSR